MLTEKQKREISTAERYYKAAKKDAEEYGNIDNLIGRALRDIRDHMKATLDETWRKCLKGEL
ncbi:MAG: hypothetical protein ABSH28_01805 [Acidobacteriota bacterium]|jgi:hypothetical protein